MEMVHRKIEVENVANVEVLPMPIPNWIGNIGIGNISTMATINMIAESKPAEKEMMVNLVMTFLA